ncbi:biotin-dependent carboxyltransferase family protein [Mucilaginibacter sp. CSA2-8R]|uniref:5-oxoprolinase subunit C family protein n=1 Tax=Mucilaginibacter sp. CSA2-8R TaxID=3141542 RepID=UPI00315DBF79
MQLTIVKPGVLSTVQDMGRWAYLSHAVPVSGPMDSLSARMANLALGNTEEAPFIEFTYAAAEFTIDAPSLLAYAGEGAFLSCHNQLLPANRPIFVPGGLQISLKNNRKGSRTYLAIAGGFDIPSVLDSYSTYLPAQIGGVSGRALQAGDILMGNDCLTILNKAHIGRLSGEVIAFPKWSVSKTALGMQNTNVIRVMSGPEFSSFDMASLSTMFNTAFTMSSQSNRMGYRLNGPVMQRVNTSELLSTAVTMGTIQVTGNGDLILLMADCQTTGGYPRIAQVASVDLPLCGQLKPDDQIFFKQISQADAEMQYIEREQNLQKVRAALNARFL